MTTDFGSLTYLKSKIENYNPQTAVDFHGSAPKAFDSKAQYIWEEANTTEYGGFVYHGPELAAYLNANGDEIVLSSIISKTEFASVWKANQDLYNLSQAGSFRVVQPVGFPSGFMASTYKTVEFNGKSYNYYKLKHPDSDLGGLIMFSGMSNDDYAQLILVEVTKILTALRTVTTNNNIGYPNLKLNDIVLNSGGSYWRFMYQWDLDAEGCLAKMIGEAEKSLQGAARDGVAPAGAEELLMQARAQWKSALNI